MSLLDWFGSKKKEDPPAVEAVREELDELLGVHILAPNATELIAEGVSAISMEGTVEELIGTVHAHPTLSEAVREAALAAEGRAIHNIPNVTGGR